MKSKIIKMSTSLVMCSLASQVFASGFQILEQNVTNLGLAYSGTAALAVDATTGYFNPAGLTRIPRAEVVISAIAIQADFDFQATSATSSFGTPRSFATPTEMTLGEDDPARFAVAPSLSIAKRLDEHWVFGFNVNSPFGLVSKYNSNGIARYIATTTQLNTVNISPSLGFQALPCLSIGFGIDAEYAKAILDSNIGNGFAGQDGFSRNHADGWGYGYHVGVLYEYRNTTRVGVNYRSKVNINADGYGEFLSGPGLGEVIGGERAIGNTAVHIPGDIYLLQEVHATVVLPETLTFSFYQELSAFDTDWDSFAITGDIAWTNWSRFHTLQLRYNPGFSTTQLYPSSHDPRHDIIPGLDTDKWANFKDSRRYALGLIWKYTPEWLFNFGIAYDQTPTRDEWRSARIPDDNRYWLALGAAFMPNERWRFDAGYAHIFFNHPSIDETAPFEAISNQPINGATLAGNYKPYANLFGLQMRYDFA